MSDFWILSGHTPVTCSSVVLWFDWYRQATVSRQVAFSVVPGFVIFTVFVGLNRQRVPGFPPLVFESMVFNQVGAEVSHNYYSTWEEAETGHSQIVSSLVSA